MDTWIIVSSLFTVILIICSLPILFRVVSQKRAIRAMLIVFFFGLLLASGIWIYGANILGLSLLQYSSGLLLVVAIYTACVVLFLFTVFSVFEASLTVWFLSEIAKRENGVSKNELYKTHGVRQIVRKRIERLLDSGDITYNGTLYELGNTQSYFRIREQVLEWYWRIFP